MLRQENIDTASTVTSIIIASTLNSDHNSTVIIMQNNKPEPISSELINLDISNTLPRAKNLENNKEPAITRQAAPKKGHRHDYDRSQSVTEGQVSVYDLQINKLCHSEADNTILPSNKADTAKQSLSRHIKSQPEGLQQCLSAQRGTDTCRSMGKLHEFLPDCEETPGPCEHLKVTQFMASIDGKEEHEAFN
ncbi:hypothetical protein O181_079349 [Austropuccinia psidii MF-1]|uniref:Uncharacterized protein n=1 Tax=Austropuccinia psidii MF-1 TaxID=1389203 RepID=A0A9Q3II56_9BASI|nr:hypothetical protein [Austropuccinia psidii MF-1]